MRSKIAVLLILGVAVVAGVSSYVGRIWVAEAIQNGPYVAVITAESVPLYEEEPTKITVGALTYVAGWVLTSESDYFGGFSGMVVGAEDNSIIAINDKGDWLEATLDYKAASPLSGGRLYPVKGGMIEALDKVDFDAESLIRTKDGFLVSFEQQHRIMEVSAIGGKGKPAVHMQHLDLSGLSNNSGLEAITQLADGALLLFAENGLDQQNTLPVWVARMDGSEKRRFQPPANYSPTDAATLPNGDVILLLRHYSQLDGVSAKIMYLTAAEINSNEVLKGTELAHLGPSSVVDNMEALDVVQASDGTVRLFMMSDDNFNPLQRTVFLIFDWKPA